MTGLTIGELAKKSGVNIETIRYYEKRGLLTEPPRSESGYRQFPEETLEQIKFIMNAKKVGFTLKEILELFSLRLGSNSTCADVKKKAEEKIKEVEEKINQLRRIKKALSEMTALCSRGVPARNCHFLEMLLSDLSRKQADA